MNIELYIAGQLCDLEKADLGIKLRRQLYNPKELNTKDSQKSYSITLPCTPRNNEIFEHKNVEETVGKFTLYPDARLYVNNILIMEGKFRLSSISADGYKGNLGVPAPLTAKDVFGERKMNDIGSWPLLDFKGEKSITEYNTTLKDDGSLRECIFPLVLYGLLPNTNDATLKEGAKFTLYDFPPSVNCIQMLKKIFTNVGYTLTGTALDDERLNHLYVSYKNPEDYIMPFEAKKTTFSGSWTNCIFPTPSQNSYTLEKKVEIIDHNYPGYKGNGKGIAACNIFRSNNLKIGNKESTSHHLNISDDNQVTYKVPQTGLYKIDLEANIKLKHNNDWRSGKNLGFEANDQNGNKLNIVERAYNRRWRSFRNMACELKLVRQKDDPEYTLSNAKMDCIFYKNNLDQEIGDNDTIFPLPGHVNFVDQAHDPDLLCGFSWGRVVNDNYDWYDRVGGGETIEEYRNPLWQYLPKTSQQREQFKMLCDFSHPIAIKHGNSWQSDNSDKIHSAVYSPGYQKEDHTDGDAKRYIVELMDESNPTSGLPKAANAFTSVEWGDRELFEDHNRSDNFHIGKGKIQQVVLLNAGEYINLITTQDMANYEDWIMQDIEFSLSIEPFAKDTKWLTMNDQEKDRTPNGSSSAMMFWDAPVRYTRDQIDLIEFLPKEVKIDDWITNFNKAFNLELIHTGEKSFALNAKERNIVKNTSLVIDLDQKMSVHQASNDTIALPRAYKLGFTIDTAEEGYVASTEGKDMSEGDMGGDIFETGSNENNQVEQTSNFSHCWYKTLTKDYGDRETIEVPVITDHEIWSGQQGYNESSNKTYFNKAQRFWYHSGETEQLEIHETPAEVAKVTDRFTRGKKPLILNYRDKPDSIMREYFTLLTHDKEYTLVECYLTPEEYNILDRAYVRLNGDLYNVVDADGFDPMGKQKTKLKLIKKL